MTRQSGRLAYFRQLFELAPAAYIITDADLVIQDANSAAVRLGGYYSGRGRRLKSFSP